MGKRQPAGHQAPPRDWQPDPRAGQALHLRLWITLALPFVCFFVPLIAGYSWSAIGPMNPVVPPVPGSESYTGRRPELPISMEYYGTSVVVVPFRAHVRTYLEQRELPLWNPFAGLGQPLAAQGEGSPYSPFALARALAPPTWANGVTFSVFLLSALAQLLLLRQLGLSAQAAALGGAAWALSGALTLHIPRDNLADQLAMIPPLFLAATWAIRNGRPPAYAVFALVAAVHGLAGFLPIAVNSLLLLVGFLAAFSYLSREGWRARLRTFGATLLALALGQLLTGPYVFPIVEAFGAAHNKNFPFLALIPMPTANVVAIFLPLLWGQPLHGWLSGGYPEVADWNNLFAYGSTGLLLLTLCGVAALRGRPRQQQATFLFFVGGGLFFLARYISLPPVAGVGLLPILSQLSPKHTTGVAVFCLVVAAAFGAEWLRRLDYRRALWLLAGVGLVTVSTVLTLVGRLGARISIDQEIAATSLGVTLVLVVLVLLGLWAATRAHTDADATFVAAATVLGELLVYLPLGVDDPWVLAARVGLFGLLLAAALLLTRRAAWLALVPGAAALAIFVAVVVLPDNGLPERREGTPPPPHLAWLRDAASGVRVFGIQPDYGGAAGIRDIEVVGPITPREYLSFLGLITSPDVYETAYYGSTFSLVHPHQQAPLYDLRADYPRARPILDWFGVRYLVLEHRIFGPDAAFVLPDLERLMPDLRVAHRTATATIVESPTSATRAVFAVHAQRVESASDAIEALRIEPARVERAVLVEAPANAFRRIREEGSEAPQIPLTIDADRPNEVRVEFDAPRPGVFVLKDSYFPGWEATLDGQSVEVVRVNGMVRGVIVPAPGRHEVVMTYRPRSFALGVYAGGAALLMVLVLLAWSQLRRAVPRQAVRPGSRAGAARGQRPAPVPPLRTDTVRR
jgi:hypothetical protein